MSALTPDGLRALRESDRADPATLLAFLVGVPLGVIHPLGVAVGAVLVGLVAPTTGRAVVLGTYLAGLSVAALSLAGWLLGYGWSLPVAVQEWVVLAAMALVAVALAGGSRYLV